MEIHCRLANWVLLYLLLLLSHASGINPDDVSNAANRGSPLPPIKPVIKPSKIADFPACKEDLKRLCDESARANNFAVLDCVQNAKNIEDGDLQPDCHHEIWELRKNLTEDGRFLEAAKSVCGPEIEQVSLATGCKPTEGKSGQMLSCLIDVQENITNSHCRQFLIKMGSIIFSDYRLISKFTDSCRDDIRKFKCGRIDLNPDDDKQHSQGETIACLSANPKDLADECKHEILRIAELQSDDFHLDRPLYFACREDRERFCEKVPAGEGKVYRCLMNHKNEVTMSTACRDNLARRQKLISQDYKVSKGLSKLCKEDIRIYKCRDETSKNREIRLAQILVCLENAVHTGYPVKGECLQEMEDHRRSLMDDYNMSPNLVDACKEDLVKFCAPKLEPNGKTIHCLMDHARPTTRKKKRITDACKRELQKLVLEADAGENWKVDPLLREACQPVVADACKDVRAGQGRVLSCLMGKVGTDIMASDCEELLLQIQYFVARDLRLDSRLFEHCQKDANKLCGAGTQWAQDPEKTGPERGPLLPCLYRHANHQSEERKLKPACYREILRVMKQRAISVDLQPEIEANCVGDLALHCLENDNKGEEMVCLQDNFEKLGPQCREAVGNFTEVEAEHLEMNTIVARACEPLKQKYCQDLKDTDHGDLMQCLLTHKAESDVMNNEKCRAGLQHFQLISLKDYRFSFKFKEACKINVMTLCKNIKTKAEVVGCLSETIKNDTLTEKAQRVSKPCRQQLKVELLQRNEDISLDPKLEESCKSDIERFCHNINPGEGQVLECLKDHQKQLSNSCYVRMFNRVDEEMQDSNVDYLLQSYCKKMIESFCSESSDNALECLKEHRDDQTFDKKCRSVVLKRMMQQNTDYRLNPSLRKACALDVGKFCQKVILSQASQPNHSFEGKVVECLKGKLQINRLSTNCEREIKKIVKDVQVDYHLDPVLADSCKGDIQKVCDEGSPSFNVKGGVMECLKLQFRDGKLSYECSQQVAKLIEEVHVDIHLDPLLNKLCGLDLTKYCDLVTPGEGRLLKCLSGVLESPKPLQPECKEILQERLQMYEYAIKVAPPESVEAVFNQVMNSPARNYLIVVGLATIGALFFGGLFCGRVTKRVRHDMKRK